jgi:hypothetical protein
MAMTENQRSNRTSGPRLRRCDGCGHFVPAGSLMAGECLDCAGLVALPLRRTDGRFMSFKSQGTNLAGRSRGRGDERGDCQHGLDTESFGRRAPGQEACPACPAPQGDVENPDYAAFARRIIRAHGRRIADGDVDALADLLDLAAELDAATRTAVEGLRAHGYSWADIAARLGTTRQAAQQRWGR